MSKEDDHEYYKGMVVVSKKVADAIADRRFVPPITKFDNKTGETTVYARGYIVEKGGNNDKRKT